MALGTAEDALSYTELKADADGIITARDIEVGRVVSAAQSAFTLAHNGPRDAVFNVFEAFFLEGRPLPGVEVAPVGGSRTRNAGDGQGGLSLHRHENRNHPYQGGTPGRCAMAARHACSRRIPLPAARRESSCLRALSPPPKANPPCGLSTPGNNSVSLRKISGREVPRRAI